MNDMSLDFIERHVEKWMVYVVFFIGGFLFGTTINFIGSIQSIPTIQWFNMLTIGLTWGTSGAFFSFLFIEVHYRKWDR